MTTVTTVTTRVLWLQRFADRAGQRAVTTTMPGSDDQSDDLQIIRNAAIRQGGGDLRVAGDDGDDGDDQILLAPGAFVRNTPPPLPNTGIWVITQEKHVAAAKTTKHATSALCLTTNCSSNVIMSG